MDAQTVLYDKAKEHLYPPQLMFSSFNKPADVSARIQANFNLLWFNYSLAITITTLAFLLTNPLIAFATVVTTFGGLYIVKTNQLDLVRKQDPKILYGVPWVFIVMLLLFTNTINLFLVGLGLGALLCGTHAVFFDAPPSFK